MTTTENPRHSSSSNEHFTPPEIVEAARRTLGRIDLDPASCALANETVRAQTYWTLRSGDPTLERKWGNTAEPSTVFLNPPGGFCCRQGRPVISGSKERRPCTESGSCGTPAPHQHHDVQSAQKTWWFKLESEWRAHRVSAAIFVCFSLELLQTTQTKTPDGACVPLQFPICYPATRIAYYRPNGNGGGEQWASPPHSSAIVYLPAHWAGSSGWIPSKVDDFTSSFAPFGRVVVPR